MNKSPSVSRILYLSHGGGPLPILGDAAHAELRQQLRVAAQRIGRPSAILVVSAHWEAARATISSAARPDLIYDYYGFPEAAYQIKYPAPGTPKLADRVLELFKGCDISAQLDAERGFDHGLYVPLLLMYPDADIPCLQLSLLSGLDPAEHIRMGNALTGLADENVLIIGSGFSFHNMRAFAELPTMETRSMNHAFESWLIDTCASTAINENERNRRLVHWESAPHARYCHPREEHLLPLHVCYGAARRACIEHVALNIMDRQASLYFW
ncbi:MAG: dioxygenase [Gammaproteobacteria bacterium]|nr:dioxygenase [Gammaproteobacteria bacterium]MDH5305377.1 dioxygenase [Gammaproteobacteria bacterium]MDH5323615.1 dioxygenase [Gammaproteobacteria bacterium]